MADAFTLRSRWVAPIDGPLIEGGMIAVRRGVIVDVGRRIPMAGQLDDLGDVVLLPGLVNAHAHLEFSELDRPLADAGAPLADWIRAVIAFRQRRGKEPGAAIASGIRESLAAGVTTVGEIATAPPNAYPADPKTNLVLFREVIGFSAARVESVAADVESRLCAGPRGNSTRIGLSPHAPYTVHPELLSRLAATARAKNIPIAMHLAESPEELEFLANGGGPLRQLLEERSMWDARAIPRGSSPIDYLKTLAHGGRVLVIHGNYLVRSEIDFLARRRRTMSVVYCPRTHAYFQHRPHPLATMLAAGVRVALGTDSRASNPDLSLLAEMQTAARLFPHVTPEQIVRMGTIEGAIALGLEARLGSLTPGKLAHIAAIGIEPGAGDPYAAVLTSGAQTLTAWAHGRRAGA